MKSLIRIVVVVSLFAAARLAAEEITVFAAASLTDALKAIAASHEKATGDKVRFNFAASNTLARQIEAGAPADIFFSADEAQMDVVAKRGFIDVSTRRSLLGNSLVIVTALDGPTIGSAADLAKPVVRYLSLANTKAVPAGVYARQYLEKLDLWESLQTKVAPAENVRAALAVVESGNAEAGIVYKTDAAISKKVKIAVEISTSETPEIRYPVALVSDSRHASAARKFLDRLSGPEAAEIFRIYGFRVLD